MLRRSRYHHRSGRARRAGTRSPELLLGVVDMAHLRDRWMVLRPRHETFAGELRGRITDDHDAH